MDAALLTFDEVSQRARAEEQRQNAALASASSIQSANYAKRNAAGNNNQPNKECDHRNHSEETCWSLHPELKKRHYNKKHQANTADVQYYAHTVTTKASAACDMDLPAPRPRFLLDSGASTHMCNDRTLLRQIRPLKATSTITFGGGHSVLAKEEGDILFNLVLQGKKTTILLRDVLYVPTMNNNLISMMKWSKQGVRSFIDDKHQCVLIKNNKSIGFVQAPSDNLLELPIIPLSMNRREAATTAITAETSRMSLLHQRCGHLNASDMKRLPQMTSGAIISKTMRMDDCDACLMSKAHQLPYPSQAQTRAEHPIELIHTDVCGPFPSSRGGFRYFISFIDDCTRLATVYFMKKKSEAIDMFLHYQAWTEKKTGNKIKVLRSDGGGEYDSGRFNRVLQQQGIVRQVSAPYSQQQNGVSERWNRTVVESARTMLAHARLPIVDYWTDAVSTATHVRNRMPTSTLTDQTPFQAFHGSKPNIDYLRVFGCIAYSLIPNVKRKKLDQKAQRCIMLGYATNYKAYQLLDLATSKIIVSRNVRFVEHKFLDDIIDKEEEELIIATSTDDEDDENDDQTELQLQSEPVSTDASSDDEIRPDPEAKYDEVDEFNEESGNCDSDPDVVTEPKQTEVVGGHINSGRKRSGLWKDGKFDILEDSIIDQVASHLMTQIPELKYGKRLSETGNLELNSICQRHNISEQAVKKAIKQMTQAQGNASTLSHAALIAQAQDLFPSDDPASHAQAMSGPNAVDWKKAEEEEMKSIAMNKTWTTCKLPAGKRAIQCKWVYKIKRDENGQPIKFKARLVAKGFTQREGLDYEETYAPVARFSSIRLLLDIVAFYDMEIHQMVVKTAFLNGDLEHEIYMCQPEGHQVEGQEQLVCKLNKSLYGLKQAGRSWYEKIDAALLRFDFTRLATDNCIYIKRSNDYCIIIALYVDDLLILSNSIPKLQQFKQELASTFEMMDMGEARFILGIKIDRNRSKKTLSISQAEYINKVLANHNMTECDSKSSTTPMEVGLKLTASGSMIESDETRVVDTKRYQAAVGSLMYAMLGTRPDVAFSVGKLARFCNAPREQHWKALKRVMRYLACTKDYSLIYQGRVGSSEEPTVIGHCDSGWGNDIQDRRSTTGYVFTMAGGAISWQSKRQATTALSSVEAEYMATTHATKEAIWWRMVLKQLGFGVTEPTTIYSDSQGSIALTKNPGHHSRSKHIDIQYHLIREHVADGSIELIYMSTQDLIADVLTKPLARDRHHKLIKGFGITTATSPIV
jgi:transposase InsO family protein